MCFYSEIKFSIGFMASKSLRSLELPQIPHSPLLSLP